MLLNNTAQPLKQELQDRFTTCFKTCGTKLWVFRKVPKKGAKKAQRFQEIFHKGAGRCQTCFQTSETSYKCSYYTKWVA